MRSDFLFVQDPSPPVRLIGLDLLEALFAFQLVGIPIFSEFTIERRDLVEFMLPLQFRTERGYEFA